MKDNPVFRYGLIMAYVSSLAWYAYDAREVYRAAHSGDPYPFMLSMDNFAVTFFSITGALYWFIFGIDRSKPSRAIPGYLLAAAHILVFALQVAIGPMIWAGHNL